MRRRIAGGRERESLHQLSETRMKRVSKVGPHREPWVLSSGFLVWGDRPAGDGQTAGC